LNSNLDRLHTVVVAHISEKNNSRAAVTARLEETLPQMLPKMVWASQDSGFDWISIKGAGPGMSGEAIAVS